MSAFGASALCRKGGTHDRKEKDEHNVELDIELVLQDSSGVYISRRTYLVRWYVKAAGSWLSDILNILFVVPVRKDMACLMGVPSVLGFNLRLNQIIDTQKSPKTDT